MSIFRFFLSFIMCYRSGYDAQADSMLQHTTEEEADANFDSSHADLLLPQC